jgi:hypothetical protein
MPNSAMPNDMPNSTKTKEWRDLSYVRYPSLIAAGDLFWAGARDATIGMVHRPRPWASDLQPGNIVADPNHCISNAERCLAIARTIADRKTRMILREMAAEWAKVASALERMQSAQQPAE